eukprot:TRINITY_DN509_c0_g1_i1.p1 TRINITY_DN509_c0_g1~~TRINITY_DN509_c0_g1_i1.p1  ORF type:complete len:188 (-),score=27.13 TRINITY_DN509_c0_g1_i1:74-601(-)
MVSLSRVTRLSIKWHWMMVAWVLIQFAFGSMMAHQSRLMDPTGTYTLFVAPMTPDEIYPLHKLSGNILMGFAVWLFFTKMYVFYKGWKRPYIPNPFVAWSIPNHYLTTFVLITTQFMTHGDASVWLASITGIQKETLSGLHALNARLLVAQACVLTAEKVYLAYFSGTRTIKKRD